MNYNEFLHTKIEVAPASGFDVRPEDIHPALKPPSAGCGGLGKTVQRWIPVTERLPEEDERVLVYLSPKDFTYTRIDTDRVLFGKWTRWGKRVSHWMPLPQAPGKEGA
ncbi:MAG: DUF551 domain-containing protein [Oscillospiraceae bacterium]|nr:DUF551 domain-containing protein [Oscillospiraceae bacterium]